LTEQWVNFADVSKVVVHEMLEEPQWQDLFVGLVRLWHEQGIKFFSPGGSPQRRLASTLHELLNDRRSMSSGSIMRASKHPDINAVLERFYAETLQRLEQRMSYE
jgi:hypothetical protein